MSTPSPVEYIWIYTLETSESHIDVSICMTCGALVGAPRSIEDKVKIIHTKWHGKGN